MENQIQVFDNAEFGSVRAIEIDNEPWFVGKDVAIALGYKDTDQALRIHVDDDDKLTRKIYGSGQGRNMTIINEGGLYSLAVRSNMPKAKEFTRWLTHDVAISIRKHGAYLTLETAEKILYNPDFIIGLAQQVKDLQAERDALKPDAEYCRNVLQSPDTMPITLIAKEYGLSGETLNKILVEAKLIRKVGKTYVLNQPYAAMGYAETETILTRGGIRKMLKWTEKGRHLIHKILQGKFATNRERIYANPELF